MRGEHFSGMICAAVLKIVDGDKESTCITPPQAHNRADGRLPVLCKRRLGQSAWPRPRTDRSAKRADLGGLVAAGVRRPRAPAGPTAIGADGLTCGIARAGWAGWSGKTAKPRDDGRGREAKERSPPGH